MAPRIDSFLRLAADQRASDLHFHTGDTPMIRYDGELVALPFRALSPDESRRFLYEIMTPEQREELERDFEIDFAYEIDGVGRFRVNAYHQSRGLGAVFRLIPEKLPTLAQLGLPRVIRQLAMLENGLVLVSGPTGSGKSTTLAAIVNEINETSERHIITIEDPIEHIHVSKRSIITQREVGQHTESFAAALRAALREAPDVLVVGELRDLQTVMLALSATETGVLVFGTLHTSSAAKSVDRILDLCPEEVEAQVRSTLSVLLRGVVAQQLLKRSGGDGMIAAVEVLLPSFALSHMIREGKTHQIDGYIQQRENEGTAMQSLDTALIRLVTQGLVDLEEALSVATNPAIVRRLALQNADE
jgi:twitching motility protein PilT